MALRVVFALAWLLYEAVPAAAVLSVPKFLIVSNPGNSQVLYVRIPDGGLSNNSAPSALITGGLAHPQGMAVDQKRSRLIIADPGLMKVVAYTLSQSGSALAVTGTQMVYASGVQARWVDVDSMGNVYFTDESTNQIMKVDVTKALKGSSSLPTVLYSGNALNVNAPSGIGVDDFFLYWSNKMAQAQYGTILSGQTFPPKNNDKSTVSLLTKDTTAKLYGLCLVLDNIFYMDDTKNIYGIKKNGQGGSVLISQSLDQPRDCVWDGDGTTYVTDKTAGKVYSFAGNMEVLAPATVQLAMTQEDAFGITLFAGATRQWLCAWLPLVVAIAGVVAAHG